MAYSDFDLKTVKSVFHLDIVETEDLFSAIPSLEISPLLAELLKQNVSLALAIGTEKASSELIIINVLLELKHRWQIGLFSGIDFTVDKEKGLNGYCDFILSRSSEQLFVETPVVAIVEAKNEKIMSGIGQCIAEMLAATLYNERDGKPLASVYGVVTTGHAWKFLKMQDAVVWIDCADYYINQPQKVVGILSSMIAQ